MTTAPRTSSYGPGRIRAASAPPSGSRRPSRSSAITLPTCSPSDVIVNAGDFLRAT